MKPTNELERRKASLLSEIHNLYGLSIKSQQKSLARVLLNMAGLLQQAGNHEPVEAPLPTEPYGFIAGRSLGEWREFAKRDDCLDLMVPSDLRQLIGAIR